MSKHRVEAFSDGVFAIVITLLILNVHFDRQHALTLDALRDLGPDVFAFVLSFIIVGLYWVSHHNMLHLVVAVDRRLLWLNLLLLLFVSFLPFPTRLISEFVASERAERVAVTFYGVALLVAGALLSVLWRYALHARLVRPDAGDQEITLLTHRLTPGLGAYAVLIIVGLFLPFVAVIGYLVIALFFLLPLRIHRR